MQSGKLLFTIIAAILLLNTPIYAKYNLVWSDEFEGPEIDKTKWTHEVGDKWHNKELQSYTDRGENSYIEDGKLVIVARKEEYHGNEYTSARMRTKGKGDFLYGKISGRIKFPKSQGMWPAFWMMPTDDEYGRWAASGEIDIVETTNQAGHIYGTIHFGGTPPHNAHTGGRYAEKGVNFSEDFHIYTLEWQPYEMKWYIDGKLYSKKNDWHTRNARFPAPFDKQFYILLNLAVGGAHPGNPDETSTFPQKMYIDWVRVYQTENKSPQVAIASPAENANIPAETDVVIKASVTDPDGDVNAVEFYDGYDLIGKDTNEPYSLNWAAPDGCYSIKAKAIDKEGFSQTATISLTKGLGCPQQPFHGIPIKIPGKFEAEDFDAGARNVAYFDSDEVNSGNVRYRKNSGVDIYSYVDQYFISRLGENEWLEYTIDVAAPGTYDIKTYATGTWWRPDSIGKFRIELDGINKTSTVTVPSLNSQLKGNNEEERRSSSFEIDPVIVKDIELTPGVHVMRFFIEDGNFSLNSFEIVRSSPDPNE